MSKLDYSPRDHEPQIELFGSAGDNERNVVTLHTGNERIIIDEGRVTIITDGGNGQRPSERRDLAAVRSKARKGSAERRQIDANIPWGKRVTGRYAR